MCAVKRQTLHWCCLLFLILLMLSFTASISSRTGRGTAYLMVTSETICIVQFITCGWQLLFSCYHDCWVGQRRWHVYNVWQQMSVGTELLLCHAFTHVSWQPNQDWQRKTYGRPPSGLQHWSELSVPIKECPIILDILDIIL